MSAAFLPSFGDFVSNGILRKQLFLNMAEKCFPGVEKNEKPIDKKGDVVYHTAWLAKANYFIKHRLAEANRKDIKKVNP